MALLPLLAENSSAAKGGSDRIPQAHEGHRDLSMNALLCSFARCNRHCAWQGSELEHQLLQTELPPALVRFKSDKATVVDD